MQKEITEEDFETMVADAIDNLPTRFLKEIEEIPVVISDRGWERQAYGLYHGDSIARKNWHNKIIIFRDTLYRDFGYDRDILAQQVERVVRHELGHHLGFDERGVQRLGL